MGIFTDRRRGDKQFVPGFSPNDLTVIVDSNGDTWQIDTDAITQVEDDVQLPSADNPVCGRVVSPKQYARELLRDNSPRDLQN